MELTQEVLIDGECDGVFPVLRHMQLRGTNFELGQQLAEINITNHGDTLDKHRVADPPYGRAGREYVERHYPIYRERMQGVAAALGADASYDPPRPGCSNAFYPPREQRSQILKFTVPPSGG